ncbi:MAG: peptidoglycan-binding protein with multiple lysin domain [Bacteroidota bacterium]|jgi:LysM repeat protein
MKSTFIAIILFIGAFNLLQANVVDSVGLTKLNDKTYIQYLVEPGETIYGLSNKFKVSVADLLDLNPALNNGLKTGQLILVPSIAQTAPKEVQEIDSIEAGKMYHTVQPGDTYYSLSKKYGIPVGDLVMMNMPELKVGQEIVLKSDKQNPTVIAQQINVVAESPTKSEKVVIKDEVTAPATSVANTAIEEDYDNGTKRILVIPFDPHLYWSDADMEIAKGSNTDMNKVRQAFRKRLNALLNPEGFETIHLLGGKMKDSLTDLNKVYSSVTYDYKDVMYTAANPKPDPAQPNKKGDLKDGFNKSLDKVTNVFSKKEEEVQQQPVQKNSSRAVHAKNPAKYFSVQIKDPDFWNYFNNKYKIDYYIFINQFEVETNFEHCLDRARQNYERNFVTHFSIYEKSGKQIAGHRIILHYNSNSNNLSQILKDNLETVANRIIAEIPKK